MLYYGRIAIYEDIDVNKASVSEDCNICGNWNFLELRCKFQSFASNDHHDIK